MPEPSVFVEAIFKGVGQVWLADKTQSGVIITVGLFICSPIMAFAAVMGSLVGTATALVTGAPLVAVSSGLYGYNSSLTFGCIFGMWFCPSPVTFCIATFGSVLAAVMTDCFSGVLAPLGLPAATMPFCFCALLFDLIQGSTPKMMAVPLAQMTVPEDHRARDQTIRRAFRAMAIIIKGENFGDFFQSYTSRNETSTDRRMLREDCACDLFRALDESGDGVLEVDEFEGMLENAVCLLFNMFLFSVFFRACFRFSFSVFKLLWQFTTVHEQGVPKSKSALLVAVFTEMTPPGAAGLGLAEWIDYIDVVICTSALKADLTTFLNFADLDASGGQTDVVVQIGYQKQNFAHHEVRNWQGWTLPSCRRLRSLYA